MMDDFLYVHAPADVGGEAVMAALADVIAAHPNSHFGDLAQDELLVIAASPDSDKGEHAPILAAFKYLRDTTDWKLLAVDGVTEAILGARE